MAATYNSTDLKEAFDLLDHDKTGKFDIHEVLENLKKLEIDTKHPCLFNLLESLGDGEIDYNEFEKRVTIAITDPHDEVGLERVFDIFIDNPEQKTITIDSLKEICASFGEILTEKDSEFIMSKVGNGEIITFDTFVNFMKQKLD